ncbi:hypothetical protein J6590_058492 [Homalodisca vitripennis]|nr:hypothetical protein J6590_058492 [Homalodisca vitripennis]
MVLSASRNALPVFDGKMPWENFLTLFETAASAHGWTPSVMQQELCAFYFEAMRWRHMEQLHRSQIKSRVQKTNEYLEEFKTDMACLVSSACPSVDDEVYESLAVEKFLDGLREPETQQAIKLPRPKTFSETLTQALEFEVKQTVCGHERVKAAEGEDVCSPSAEEIVQRVIEKLKTGRTKIRCLSCGEKEHLRNKCRSGSKDQRKTTTGEASQFYGETTATFLIGGGCFKHRALEQQYSTDSISLLCYGTSKKPNGDKGSTEDEIDEGQGAILKPKSDDKKLGCGVLVARTLFLIGKEFSVLVINVNDYGVTLKKGSALGCCSVVSSVVCQIRSTQTRLSEKLKDFVSESCRELTKKQGDKVREIKTKYQDVFEIRKVLKGELTLYSTQ